MDIGPEYIVGGFAGMAAAIAVLWKANHNQNTETKTDLREMRALREQDSEKIITLTRKIAHVEGTRDGILKGVEHISTQVIEEVRRLSENNKD